MNERLEPIASLAGDAKVHERARRYNARLAELQTIESDVNRMERWNQIERHGQGFFQRNTLPPVETHHCYKLITELREELAKEREEIERLAYGSVKS